MGTFLAISAVVGRDVDSCVACLQQLANDNDGQMKLAPPGCDEFDVARVVGSERGTTILYPEDFFRWDWAAEQLSANLDALVFSFHIHDGDLWMYLLFDQGREVDWFNPIPGYWNSVTDEEAEKWRGNSQLITEKIPDIEAASLEPYLVRWAPDEAGDVKAFPDDEHFRGQDWQLLDFMRKVGFSFPDTVDDPGVIAFDFYIPDVMFKRRKSRPSSPKAADQSPPIENDSKPNRPWWKLW